MKKWKYRETVMAGNQFAVYQLREIPENRKKRFRSYAELQKEHIQIRYTDYKQVYSCLLYTSRCV